MNRINSGIRCQVCQDQYPNSLVKKWKSNKALTQHLRMAHTLRPEEFLALKERLN